ncbi:FecR family protein [Sphingomonas dokdonensis]|uniref:Fec operon regulator FecR n=1 Tax=Sphingomonas dokdonensis TaxID=344880 RepID=A0A245ZV59_9SPHN|nr:FecR domain-containing protein [Sphingomonas dokdonensis]OWK33634.1 fec operon regulator FecR [Sphingomonas dokdonensis]
MTDKPKGKAADAAAAWYARSHAPMMSAEERAALDAWIKDDAAADQAWAQVGKLDALLGEVANDPSISALRETAIKPARPPAARRWVIGGALAAALVAAVGLPLASTLITEAPSDAPAPRQSYAATNQAKSIPLADGSTMLLDARSAATVSIGPVRAVALDRGRALFTVAKDKAHPFVVTANGNSVTALGTQFSVEQAGDKTIVALLEGSVHVATHTGTRTLQPGQSLRADAATLSVAADAAKVAGWRDGRLDFSAVPLGNVVTALNRYGTTRIVIADPVLARQAYSGSFTTDGGGNALVAALVATGAARVKSRKNGTITLSR